jgi:3-oxoacyl-[acyl-carrier protein] reductase
MLPSVDMTSSDFIGKTALVTGAGAGIGRAVAEVLGARGATVAVHYHNSRDGAAAVCAAIGSRARSFHADVTQRNEVDALVRDVEAQLGPIDILVNNAGDLIERRTLADMSDALFRQVIDVNVTSTFLCCQAVAASMTARSAGGVIVNMASLAAHNGGGPGAFVYAASKAAIIAMTKAIAKELAPQRIRANCVSPGLIGDTNFHGRFTKRDTFEAIAKTVPLGRAGTPAEVATVVAFLASDDAAYLTGETIEINGGMFMR